LIHAHGLFLQKTLPVWEQLCGIGCQIMRMLMAQGFLTHVQDYSLKQI